MKPLVTLVLAIAGSAAMSAEPTITAKTGPPRLAEGHHGGVQMLLSKEDYTKKAAQFGERLKLAPLAKVPEALGVDALYGFGFSYVGRARTFVLDRSGNSGYVLHLDRNSDGDLTNDEPVHLRREDGELPSATFEETAKDSVNGVERTRRIGVRFFLEEVALPGQPTRKALILQSDSYRSGVLDVSGKQVPFVLHGDGGIYDQEDNTLAFDVNGDGTPDIAAGSEERYDVSERLVNLAGRSFEFKVDHYGDALTLVPLPDKRPDRAALGPGHEAPEFTATDIVGRKLKLSDYHGKVILLEFWGLWCAPCVAEVPKLVDIYQTYHPHGFEIIGVHNGQTVSELKAFMAKSGMTWTQIAEERTDPIHQYRVKGWPSYFIIDKDGKFLDSVRPDKLVELLDAKLGHPKMGTAPAAAEGVR